MLGVPPSSWETQYAFSPTSAPSSTSVMSMFARSISYAPLCRGDILIGLSPRREPETVETRKHLGKFRLGMPRRLFPSMETPWKHGNTCFLLLAAVKSFLAPSCALDLAVEVRQITSLTIPSRRLVRLCLFLLSRDPGDLEVVQHVLEVQPHVSTPVRRASVSFGLALSIPHTRRIQGSFGPILLAARKKSSLRGSTTAAGPKPAVHPQPTY